MKIIIGADHRGYALKSFLMKSLPAWQWVDVGTDSDQRSDYPLFARRVCAEVRRRKELGVLICGSGVGMSIAANRFKGIYAALCWRDEIALAARRDDNINVLVLPADFLDNEVAVRLVMIFVSTPFQSGRYQERLACLDHDSFTQE